MDPLVRIITDLPWNSFPSREEVISHYERLGKDLGFRTIRNYLYGAKADLAWVDGERIGFFFLPGIFSQVVSVLRASKFDLSVVLTYETPSFSFSSVSLPCLLVDVRTGKHRLVE